MCTSHDLQRHSLIYSCNPVQIVLLHSKDLSLALLERLGLFLRSVNREYEADYGLRQVMNIYQHLPVYSYLIPMISN